MRTSAIGRSARTSLAVLLMVGLACSSERSLTAVPVSVLGLEVTVAKPNLVVRNTGATLVRFMSIDEELRTLMSIAPCDTTCPGVAPGATLTLPLTTALGYSASTTALIIAAWQFSPGPGDRVDGSMQSARVRVD